MERRCFFFLIQFPEDKRHGVPHGLPECCHTQGQEAERGTGTMPECGGGKNWVAHPLLGMKC